MEYDMNPVLIAVIIVVFLLALAILVWKSASEKKTKKNYKPPVASEKKVLPKARDEQLPAKSGQELRFCPFCGGPNSNQNTYCSKCGAKI